MVAWHIPAKMVRDKLELGDVKILFLFPTSEIAIGISGRWVKTALVKKTEPDGMVPLVLSEGKGRGSARLRSLIGAVLCPGPGSDFPIRSKGEVKAGVTETLGDPLFEKIHQGGPEKG